MTRLQRVLPSALLVVGILAFVFYVASGVARSLTLTQLDPLYTVAFGMFLPLGTFIALRRAGNPIAWIMIAIGFCTLVSAAATEYATRALLIDPGSLPAGPGMAFVSELLGIPALALLPFLMLLFPTGQLPSRRWKWVAGVAGANMTLLVIALSSLWPIRGPQLLREDIPEGLFFPPVVFEIGWILLMASAVAGLVSMVARFRRSSGVERQQLKWMAYAAAVVGALVVVNFFIFDPLGVDDPALRTVSEQTLNLAVAGIPIAAAIAISRYRLYDIDVVINRTLVYALLTAVLAAAYVGLVFMFQAVLAPVTAESDLAIAASTLAVAALFRPARARVQGFIDRRFYRRKFDAQRTLEDFSAHMRDEVELESLSSKLTAVVSDTMQPAHVSIWLRGQGARS
jgi:hypothetical protein